MRTLLLLLVLFLFEAVPATTGAGNPTRAFDRYGRIRWEDEKARLDNFAIQVTNEPTATGYFLVNAGKLSCKGEAQEHAFRARNYLMKVRQIPWNRIIWRDTGYGDEFEVIMWIVPKGAYLDYEFTPPTAQHIVRNCHGHAKP